MSTPPTFALVPLRSPGVGKTRLAAGLSAQQRAALSGAMLADVCRALQGAPLDGLWVLAGGEAAAAAASALGIAVLPDPPEVRGLDGAIRAAARCLDPAADLLVVTADLPRLAADDVAAVLATPADVVVAPTADGGTGALLRRPGSVLSTAYGPDSARRHQAAARAAGLHVEVVRRVGFDLDVDTIADLGALGEGPLGPATAALLADWPTPSVRTG